MRLCKQTFEALVLFKCKSLEKNVQMNSISKVKKRMKETTHASLLALCNNENVKHIKHQVLVNSRTWVNRK